MGNLNNQDNEKGGPVRDCQGKNGSCKPGEACAAETQNAASRSLPSFPASSECSGGDSVIRSYGCVIRRRQDGAFAETTGKRTRPGHRVPYLFRKIGAFPSPDFRRHLTSIFRSSTTISFGTARCARQSCRLFRMSGEKMHISTEGQRLMEENAARPSIKSQYLV